MKILVTGGAGFIGSHVVDWLAERGHGVIVLDNLDPQVHGSGATAPVHIQQHLASGAARFVRGDVTDRAALESCLADVEAVVHLAATVGVGQSMYAPYYYVHTNCDGTGLLLDLVVPRRAQIRKLVVASSMSLYGEGAYRCPACGGTDGQVRDEAQLAAGRWETLCRACGKELVPEPTPETKPAEIQSIYAATKRHQEDLFISFGRAYGIPTFALRFFNTIGPRQSLSNPYTGVAAIFLSRLLNDRAPLVFEDGLQSRDFISVRDVARAVGLAAEYGGTGAHVLNVGTGRRTSIGEVAQALARALGREIAPVLLGRYRAGDIRHCFCDPGQAERILGFRAEISLDAALPDLIAWCQSQKPADSVEESLAQLDERGLVR
jgi:dTDP-L-rhamnose 4-epimerase